MVVVEQRFLNDVVDGKFRLLKQVRELEANKQIGLTLSIGVGSKAGTLLEAKEFANKALDMSLGRGGDQACVKTANSFKFYGGNSKEVEKRTKVKARVIARALLELIKTADNVVVMGHKFSDLDSVGAAFGLASAIRAKGFNCFVWCMCKRVI